MDNFTKVRAKSYEEFCFTVTADLLVFVPREPGSYELPAFKINEATARLLESAAKTMRERLDRRARGEYT